MGVAILYPGDREAAKGGPRKTLWNVFRRELRWGAAEPAVYHDDFRGRSPERVQGTRAGVVKPLRCA